MNYHQITDFHASRKKGVGSSDIPILVGYSERYGQTPITLYREKLGLDPQWEGNEATKWGQRLERLILDEWIETHFEKNARNHYSTEAIHPDYPFCRAHADMVVSKRIPQFVIEGLGSSEEPKITLKNYGPFRHHIVEAKSASFMAAKRRDDENYGYSTTDFTADGIPASVFCQVQWQLFCYQADSATVALLTDTSTYREYGPILPNKSLQQQLFKLASDFWHCVEAETPPEPHTWNDVKILYPEDNASIAVIDGETLEEVNNLVLQKKSNNDIIKTAGKENDDIKNRIGVLIGENQGLYGTDGKSYAATYNQTRRDLDWKKLPAGIAEAIKPWIVEKTTRCLRIKKEK